ncbi:TonB-dependent receptor [Microbulbifer bruguierae]|uniref:TonB-dependent receptor n=1 Tax=Microbulbifer bruguierae TaxID=3029061 RepID=A0ABY8NF21_9GAMM|nr:TonB-dependent receptor [Microbulbifer bruguierae]WGL16083.1 TonB-dependent receptor [Microbulbifer bruguierae]
MFKRHLLSSSIAMATVLGGMSGMALAQNSEFDAEVDDTSALEEVVVVGLRASLEKAIDIKREKFQIVDSIVAEDIGKFPDNNVAESLQRVTGVQVTDRGAGEVSGVSIRGLNDVTTTVNGRNIFTASGRYVALQDIPASLLGQVNVYKTRSADLIASGIAGQIDIQTHRPFDFDDSKFVVVSRGIYQEQADSVDPNISALASNRWETSAGDFGALVNVSYARTNFLDEGAKAGAAVPFRAPSDPDAPMERLFSGWQAGTDRGLSFAAGSTLEDGTEYLLGRDAIIQNSYSGERERPAANISLQWAPNDSSEYLFETFYNGYRQESVNNMLLTYTDAWWGVDPADPVVLYEGTNIVKERYVNESNAFTSGDFTKGKTDSFVYALGGKWDVTENLRLESELVYQKSTFESEFLAMQTKRPDNSIPRMYVDFNSGNGIPGLTYLDDPDTADIDESDLTNPALWQMSNLYDTQLENEGDAKSLTFDGEYFVEWGIFDKIEFGLRYDRRTAVESLYTRSAGIGECDTCSFDNYPGLLTSTNNFYDGESDMPGSWAVVDGRWLYAHGDEIRRAYSDSLLTSDEMVLPETFAVDETQVAVYLQTEFSTEIAGRTLDGEVGIRVLDVDTDIEFPDQFNVGEVILANNAVTRFMPSLMVRYHLTEDLIARASYGETLRMPNFVDLNPNITYQADVTNIGYGQASGGNPDLRPTESINIDIALEYYFADASSIHVTWFQRDIEGLVAGFRKRINADNPNDVPDIGFYDYILSQPDNASGGVLKGLELGMTYFPESLPGILDGFGVQASYTILDSGQDVPITDEDGNVIGTDKMSMFGVSDSSYSVVLAYDNYDLDMRLAYVWREDFLYGNEAALFANPLGIYHSPENSLDFQASYDVTDDLVITFDGTNLTEEKQQEYYEYADLYNFGNFKFSRTFALGARYSF